MRAKSIYRQFYQKLIIATSILIFILSVMFYAHTKMTIYEGIKGNLLLNAKLVKKISIIRKAQHRKLKLFSSKDIKVRVIKNLKLSHTIIKTYQIGPNHYAKMLYPLDLKKHVFVEIVKNINSSRKMLKKIFNNIMLLSFAVFIAILFYAFAVSKALLKPIVEITNKLSKMDENYLVKIELKNLPIEFHPLANSVNKLTKKIKSFLRFKKELFIGAAHELKTPLAVMKLKNEVTLIKKRDSEKYEETLRLNIKEIDNMNIMVGSILSIGRAEGSQFEKPKKLDLVKFIQEKFNDYAILAKQKSINLSFINDMETLPMYIQETLLVHIIQNFIQNAIKFTDTGKNIDIILNTEYQNVNLIVQDEGSGVNEKLDLFAPFVRVGGKAGVGLGLFLAQNAASAIGANISIYNRKDSIQGTVAKVSIPLPNKI